jgi:RNA recognition motif-containing protein
MMKLFVGNLPYSATEADVQNFFAQAGVTVDSVNVMRDRFSGEARGFGFVEITDDTAANHAIEACNGRDLMGRALVVNEARPMVPREGGGGGGRGFGGGKGGGGNRRGGDRNRY